MDRSCSLWHPVDLVLDTTSGCGCDATASQTKNLLLFKTVSESRWGARARSCDRRLAECPAPALWHRCAKAPGRGPAGHRWLSPANPHPQLTLGSVLSTVPSHDCARWSHCLRPAAGASLALCAELSGPMRCNLPFFASGFHCHDTRGWQRFKREPQWNYYNWKLEIQMDFLKLTSRPVERAWRLSAANGILIEAGATQWKLVWFGSTLK